MAPCTKVTHLTTKGKERMNADQLKGNWMQFQGELKKQWGKFTDDDLKQIDWNYDKFSGKVQERYGDQKDNIRKWTDQWHQRQETLGQKTR
jgi:uncharacterized protein YjbJ (UPF0337 family)